MKWTVGDFPALSHRGGTILLNGEQMSGAIFEADEEAGIIKRWRKDAAGAYVLNAERTEVEHDVLRGEVKIEFQPGSQAEHFYKMQGLR